MSGGDVQYATPRPRGAARNSHSAAVTPGGGRSDPPPRSKDCRVQSPALETMSEPWRTPSGKSRGAVGCGLGIVVVPRLVPGTVDTSDVAVRPVSPPLRSASPRAAPPTARTIPRTARSRPLISARFPTLEALRRTDGKRRCLRRVARFPKASAPHPSMFQHFTTTGRVGRRPSGFSDPAFDVCVAIGQNRTLRKPARIGRVAAQRWLTTVSGVGLAVEATESGLVLEPK